MLLPLPHHQTRNLAIVHQTENFFVSRSQENFSSPAQSSRTNQVENSVLLEVNELHNSQFMLRSMLYHLLSSEYGPGSYRWVIRIRWPKFHIESRGRDWSFWSRPAESGSRHPVLFLLAPLVSMSNMNSSAKILLLQCLTAMATNCCIMVPKLCIYGFDLVVQNNGLPLARHRNLAQPCIVFHNQKKVSLCRRVSKR